jgi:plasmid stability protein
MATLNIKNFDDALYERLKARAARQRRSVSQEVAHLVAESLDRDAEASLLELEGLGKAIWKDQDAAAHVAAERDAWD